jgi:3-hydroxyisobutyrate dehydrogenase-like beta-hydroxyacid dehydrogenase
MHKHLNIALNLAEGLSVPMHMTATAMQLFHAGKSKYLTGDNWVVTRVIEGIMGVALHR